MKQVKSVMMLTVGLLVGFFTGAILTGGYSAPRFNYDQPVGQVGETIITRGQLAEATITQNGISVLETDMRYRAFVEEAARISKITVTPEELKQRVDEYKNLVGQFDQLSDILGSKKILDSIPQEMLYDETRFTMLAEKVMKVTLTDADAMKWYRDNPKMFFRPKMVKLTLVKTDEYAKAKSALKRLDADNPADNAQMISAQLSDDKAVRDARGDMGWWSKEAMLIPAFADAIFNARNGQGLKVDWISSERAGNGTHDMFPAPPALAPAFHALWGRRLHGGYLHMPLAHSSQAGIADIDLEDSDVAGS